MVRTVGLDRLNLDQQALDLALFTLDVTLAGLPERKLTLGFCDTTLGQAQVTNQLPSVRGHRPDSPELP